MRVLELLVKASDETNESFAFESGLNVLRLASAAHCQQSIESIFSAFYPQVEWSEREGDDSDEQTFIADYSLTIVDPKQRCFRVERNQVESSTRLCSVGESSGDEIEVASGFRDVAQKLSNDFSLLSPNLFALLSGITGVPKLISALGSEGKFVTQTPSAEVMAAWSTQQRELWNQHQNLLIDLTLAEELGTHRQRLIHLSKQQAALEERRGSVSHLHDEISKLRREVKKDDNLAELSEAVVKQLEALPAARERLDSRRNELSQARMETPALPPVSLSSLFSDKNFSLGLLGMAACVGLSIWLDLPLLALGNLGFAVLLVLAVLRWIDELETQARMTARLKAVESAEERIERENARETGLLRRVSEELGFDPDELRTRLSTFQETRSKLKEREQALTHRCGDQSFEELEREMALVREQVSELQDAISNVQNKLTTSFAVSELGVKIRQLDSELAELGIQTASNTTKDCSWDQIIVQAIRSERADENTNSKLERLVEQYLKRLSEGMYDTVTISNDATLTIAGPAEVFPVSYRQVDSDIRQRVELAMRLGAADLFADAIKLPFLVMDSSEMMTPKRRLFWQDALVALGKKTQVIVATTVSDWDEAFVRGSVTKV